MTRRICSVPWQEIWINPELHYGLCCKENQRLVDHSDSTSVTLEQHWSKSRMVNVRQRFLAGDAVPECDLCWQNERDGKTSMRMRRNIRYLGHAEADASDVARFEQHIDSTDLIEGLNLSCGNLCQLRCITCNPSYSRSIKKDYDQLGWSLDHKSRFNVVDGTNRTHSLSTEHTQTLKQITPRLKWIALAGGEPSISRPLQEYLSWCVDQGHNEHIRLLITTNGVNVKSQFLDLISRFQQTSLTISVDGHGKLDEYLRYPGNWQKKLAFIDTCQSRFTDVDLHSVVYGLNVLAIDQLINFSSERGMRHSLEYMIWPDALAVSHLPWDLRDLAQQRLQNNIYLIESRQHHYNTVSDYERTLDCVKSLRSHCNVDGTELGWVEMQRIMNAYDRIRSAPLHTLIPDLADRY